MEIKLSVSIGATLQVKNAKGEWDWIKPEVGAEVSISPADVSFQKNLEDEELVSDNEYLQRTFGNIWDNVIGPQFANVVKELIADPVAAEKPAEEAVAETAKDANIQADTKTTTDDEEYY
jgi:hypothetical protein